MDKELEAKIAFNAATEISAILKKLETQEINPLEALVAAYQAGGKFAMNLILEPTAKNHNPHE